MKMLSRPMIDNLSSVIAPAALLLVSLWALGQLPYSRRSSSSHRASWSVHVDYPEQGQLTLPVRRTYGTPDQYHAFEIRRFAIVDDYMILVFADRLEATHLQRIDSLLIPHSSPDYRFPTMRPVSAVLQDRTSPKAFWTYTAFSGALDRFDLSSSRLNQTHASTLGPGFIDVAVARRGLLALRFSSAAQLAHVDVAGHALSPAAFANPLRVYNTALFVAYPSDVRLHMNRAHLTTTHDGNIAVLAYAYAPTLRFIRLDTGVAHTIAGPEFVTQDFAIGDADRFVQTDATSLSYLDVEATTELVVALYSGRTNGSHQEHRAFGSTLHIFTPTGRLLSVVRLQEDVRDIVVCPQRGALYGLRERPFPAIVEFDARSLVELADSSEARQAEHGPRD